MFAPNAPNAVFGVAAPTPRPTALGLWLAFSRLVAPLLAGLLAFDVAVWALGWLLFDACVAVWCVL